MRIQVSRHDDASLGPASRVSTVNALNFRIIKRTLFAELRNTVQRAKQSWMLRATARILWATVTPCRQPERPDWDRSFDVLGKRFRPALELSSFLFRPLFALLLAPLRSRN